MPRKTIPKALKNKVWDHYIGSEFGKGQCYCCKKNIDSKDFECGHVKAVKFGGQNTLENLRPICSCCNKSMGTQNMNQFIEEYFPSELNKVISYVYKIENIINTINNIIK